MRLPFVGVKVFNVRVFLVLNVVALDVHVVDVLVVDVLGQLVQTLIWFVPIRSRFIKCR